MGNTHKIAVMGGDGTGPEGVVEGLKVLQAAASKFDFTLELTDFDYGGDRYLETGEVLPENAVEECAPAHRLLQRSHPIYGEVGVHAAHLVPDHRGEAHGRRFGTHCEARESCRVVNRALSLQSPDSGRPTAPFGRNVMHKGDRKVVQRRCAWGEGD